SGIVSVRDDGQPGSGGRLCKNLACGACLLCGVCADRPVASPPRRDESRFESSGGVCDYWGRVFVCSGGQANGTPLFAALSALWVPARCACDPPFPLVSVSLGTDRSSRTRSCCSWESNHTRSACSHHEDYAATKPPGRDSQRHPRCCWGPAHSCCGVRV